MAPKSAETTAMGTETRSLVVHPEGEQLQFVRPPDALHRAQRDADGFGGSGNRDAPISPELLRRRPSSAGPRAHPEFKRTVLTDLAKADRDAAEAADGLAKTEKKTDLFTLAAPIDGIVQDLAVHTPAARKTVGGKRIAGIRPESQVRTRLSGGGGSQLRTRLGNYLP